MVVMPCPTSARGTAKDAVPSLFIWIAISPEVGAAASVSASPRSSSSAGSGGDGIAASASRPANDSAPMPAATARVGAASR